MCIFKGWKDNPVTFDTVFNQSEISVGWGAEDILNIFEKSNDCFIYLLFITI